MAPKRKAKAEADEDYDEQPKEPKEPKAKAKKPAKEPKKEVKKPSKPYRRPDFGETIYCVQYAASGRAQCKGCGTKIEQGSVRVGLSTPGEGDYDMTGWWMLDCVASGPLAVSETETLQSASQLEGWCDMEPSDQAMLTKWFDEHHAPGSAPASKPAKKAAAAKVEEGAAEEAAEGAEGASSSKDAPKPPRGTYLACPTKADRDQVQRLGAKWDSRKQQFFAPFSVALDGFGAWLTEETDREAHAAAHAAAAAAAADAAAAEAMDVDDDEAEEAEEEGSRLEAAEVC